jgi:hypothetical protein
MGTHMKTTIEIADDLFNRVQQKARKEKTTFRELTETGLRLVLANTNNAARKKLPPLVVVRGKGINPEFKDASWEKLRDTIYEIPGA